MSRQPIDPPGCFSFRGPLYALQMPFNSSGCTRKPDDKITIATHSSQKNRPEKEIYPLALEITDLNRKVERVKFFAVDLFGAISSSLLHDTFAVKTDVSLIFV